MKTLLLFITLFTLSFSTVVNAKSIASLDEHETELIACLNKAKDSKVCFNALTGQYFLDIDKMKVPSNTVVNFYVNWIKDNSIFSIYKVNETNKGNFQVRKNFLVENNKGDLLIIDIIYRRALGKWQIKSIDISNKKDTIDELLER
jgi:hypothetical protein